MSEPCNRMLTTERAWQRGDGRGDGGGGDATM